MATATEVDRYNGTFCADEILAFFENYTVYEPPSKGGCPTRYINGVRVSGNDSGHMPRWLRKIKETGQTTIEARTLERYLYHVNLDWDDFESWLL